MEYINEFRGEYFFLSNFLLCTLVYKGLWYKSSEHAYQATKATHEVDRFYVASAMTCKEARKRGREIKCRVDWDDIKVEVMQEIVWCKFSQNPYLAEKLIATGDAILVEGNWWGDTFWGVCNGKGLNLLGGILMDVRDWLINGLPEGRFNE